MARTFRRHRQTSAIAEMNVTNLVDLGFTLLIIFMIATPLIHQEQTVPVNLPVESRSAQSKPDPLTQFVTIVIRPDGSCLLDGQSTPLTNMQKALASYSNRGDHTVFRIRMDAQSTAQQFIAVMDALKQNGLAKVSFDTQIATSR